MEHQASLIATVAMGLVLALACGYLASRLRLPPLVGYLVAGILASSFAPGVADQELANQLAEIGVMLLMFGVGLHFSASDLLAVRWISVPGAVGQIVIATAIGTLLGMAFGWSFGAGLVLGLSLSVASTVVLLRALESTNALESANGRIAVGWLIVEDMAMVLVLVLLPALSEVLGGTSLEAAAHGAEHAEAAVQSTGGILLSLAITLGKVSAFVAIALVVGPRVVPWILRQVARTGSRELFTLSVLAVALGIAFGSAQVFGVSFALGAFFAGLVLSNSDLSHQAAEDSLPLQDAFAVLFFVSVGMLFDPSILVRDPLGVIAVLLFILVVKSVAALLLVLLLGFPLNTAVMVSASLSQIGEFSFILAGIGISLNLLPPEGRDLILAGALLSITLNRLAFAAVEPVTGFIRQRLPVLAGGAVGRDARLAALEEEFAAVRRKREERKAQIQVMIERLPMFAGLNSEERSELIALFRPHLAQPGQRIIRKGDRGDAMFFISSGTVEVSVAGRQIKLGPGQFFGEMALLTGARRTADVTATDYCELLTLDRHEFREFLEKYPDFKAEIDKEAARRAAENQRPAAPAADGSPVPAAEDPAAPAAVATGSER
jgi:CPA2 family monovalent cation:H+ antiporter-2